ncbi:protein translocase subunit SecDF [Chryseobacterium sp. 6424]|uniref:protein translocase subunit SecD n=1 Tax=Chryseobacterium sp. 6424 TaxID=2039166 RepID=UPI000EFD453F|nr:protein translocase subunit SecD [Chryseobacterium sp. 6424]AYO58109.1 protein translocase subunit SecDF [Chryseobacterium sp. 6424]
MQGKGLITLVAVILGLICLNELLPTWYASKLEKQATEIAGDNPEKYQKELARLSKDTLNLGFTKLYYSKSKEKEMKLGLDLKGGINVLLEINQRDLVNNLTNYSTNPVLIEALDRTDQQQKNSTNTYIKDFFTQFEQVNKEKGTNLKLADPEIFGNTNLSEIKFNTPDDKVRNIIENRIELSTGTAYEVIRTRIDKMGVTQPNVQRVPRTGRISVEMPGVKDIDRVKKMLQTSAKLQFWEVQQVQEVLPYFEQLNTIVNAKADSIGVPANTNLVALMQLGTLRSNGVANVKLSDTAVVNKILNSEAAKNLRPQNLKYSQFMWGYKPEVNDPNNLVLYAIRGNINQKAPVDGAVESARVNYDDLGRIVVDMQMDSKGSKDWKTLTSRNVNKPVAVTLDNVVYTAPNVVNEIPNGRTQISGSFSQEEAQDLVNVLGAGKLPAGAKIVQAEVVGPSLGAESVQAGMYSFIIAFVIIILYMLFYYGGAGVYAIIAISINLFYLLGIMDSVDATLTLPGIAGIVLSMAMSIDANVIVYERTKEELFAGKNIREAYNEGFKFSLSAIIDGNITSLLTAIVLYIFGTGPIQGFAVTLGIGILLSMFTCVVLTRVLIFSRLEKGKSLSVWTKFSKNIFRNTWINFIGKRKLAYIFSGIITLICLASIFTSGFKYGVDFKGGRSYVVRFANPVVADEAAESLEKQFVNKEGQKNAVDVKTFGSSDQLKITTDYRVDEESLEADLDVENKLFTGLQPYLPEDAQISGFKDSGASNYGIVSSVKVGPTVADDIKSGGAIAMLIALAGIFLYILVRFKKWQFSTGAIASLVHDAIVILGVYSLLKNVMPFNMEINQDFIAAILTVLGYSINDTVIIFDRIREYLAEKKSLTLEGLFNDSISSTLGRTFNTAFMTFLVILAIFIFGGENLRGFMFALLIGVGFGTYSTWFIASAVSYDLLKKKNPAGTSNKLAADKVTEDKRK